MKKKVKDKNKIFNSIRKPTAPQGTTFRTKKDELDRKKKHKGDKYGEDNY